MKRLPKVAFITFAGFLAWLGVAWIVPNVIGIGGAERWIIRGLLAITGLLAAAAIIWFVGKQQPETGKTEPEKGGLETGDVDVLIHEAVGKLAHAGLGKIGTLPLVFVVGEQGSAKTSILASTGLNAELLAGKVYKDNSVVPTAIANLWVSGRAILADISGAALADSAKWSHLIRRLRPHRLGAVVGRGGQTPRAALVCVNVEKFFSSGAAEASVTLARDLRRRLGEIAQSLGVQLPTYVLFTRMDRIPFFTEYVGNLTTEEAAQVLGVTFPVNTDVSSQQAGVREAAAFDDLYRSLCDFRPMFLQRERDLEQLPGIYEFPRELRKLRGLLVDFLAELCRSSQLAAGPFLRGFYFSGVRPVVVQEAAPAPLAARAEHGSSRFIPADATTMFGSGSGGGGAAYADVAAAPAPATKRVPQWVFVNRLFSEILLADHVAMGTAASSTTTSLLRRILLFTAIAACVICAVGFTVSYINNRELQSRVRDAAITPSTAQANSSAVPSIDALNRLETLRQSLDVLTAHRRNGAPWSYRWGLYTGDELYAKTRESYWTAFQTLLLTYTQGGLLDDLRRLPATPGPEYGPTYDTLKAYLITTSNPDKSTRAFLSPLLLDRWRQGRNVSPKQTELAQQQFDFYSDELPIENPFSKENDAGAVDKARRYLAQFGSLKRIYLAMLTDAAKASPPVNFNKHFAGSASVLVDAYEVPGSFTKPGWEAMKVALQNPRRYFSGDQWVLGDHVASDIDRAQLETQVHQWYHDDLVAHWRAYLKNASVVKYRDLKDASEKLTTLSTNQSPLLALFWLASQNTALDVPRGTSEFQPIHAVVTPDSADRYIGANNQKYVDALAVLQIAVDAAAAQQPPNETAVAQVQTAAASALDAKRQIANTFRAIGADQTITVSAQRLLEEPIVVARALVTSQQPAEINAAAKTFCGQFRALWSKYPFNPNARAQATVAEANALLRKPDGALWSFYDQRLQKILIAKDGQYQPVVNSPVKLNADFVRFFNEIATWSEDLYAGGTKDPHLSFSLKPVPTEGIQQSFSLNNQTVAFSGGAPTQTRFTWQPAGANEARSSVRFGDTDLPWFKGTGPWAVFQFFGRAERSHSVGTLHMFDWTIQVGKSKDDLLRFPNDKPVTIRFQLDMEGKPPIFQSGVLARTRCVSDAAAQ